MESSHTGAGLSAWIQNAPADDFWCIAVVLVIATIACFTGAFYFFYKKRIIEDTPTSKIRSAAQGYAEFSGHGELMEGQPITAPLTRTICTWYKYKIEEYHRSGKNSQWVTIDQGNSDELFLLLDDTGQCVIDPEGAYVTPARKDCWYGHRSRPDRGPSYDRSWFSFGSRRYRYSEERMHPGESLYAIGLYKTVGGANSQFNINEDVRDMLGEWKKDTEYLMTRFDKNRDGQIDMEEWQAVREEAYQAVMARHADVQNMPPVNILSDTHEGGHFCCLLYHSQSLSGVSIITLPYSSSYSLSAGQLQAG